MHETLQVFFCFVLLPFLQNFQSIVQRNTALLWQKEANDKSDISCKKKQNVSVISTDITSMEYHEVYVHVCT